MTRGFNVSLTVGCRGAVVAWAGLGLLHLLGSCLLPSSLLVSQALLKQREGEHGPCTVSPAPKTCARLMKPLEMRIRGLVCFHVAAGRGRDMEAEVSHLLTISWGSEAWDYS